MGTRKVVKLNPEEAKNRAQSETNLKHKFKSNGVN